MNSQFSLPLQFCFSAIFLIFTTCASVNSQVGSSSSARVNKAYPVSLTGMMQVRRYAKNKPITIWFPQNTKKPVPIVVFNHGRPFKSVRKGVYRLHPFHPLVDYLTSRGIAVAIPIRTGYFSSTGADRERIPCNRPKPYDFRRAASAASRDVVSAVQFVRTLPMIDRTNVFVGGTSAGGFATVVSLDKLNGLVKGAVVFNGGRCGKRGRYVNGIRTIERLFFDAGRKSSMPVVFYASSKDNVIPPTTTKRLRSAFCSARGSRCAATVSLVELPGVGHRLGPTVSRSINSLLQFMANPDGFAAKR